MKPMTSLRSALAKLVTSDTVRRPTLEGLHALHLAAELNAPKSVLMSIINADPGSLKARDKYGHIPLHHALEKGASLEVIKLLCDEHPEGIACISNDKSLPLHCALLHDGGVEEEIVEFLLMQNPDAAKAKTHDGWLPLHCAAEFHGSKDIISMLFKANPEGIKEVDDLGMTPLHWAVAKNSSQEVVEFLVEEYPDALLTKDKQGQLPLHLCVSREDCQIDTVRALLPDADTAMKAVQTKMDGGLLPIHCASQAQGSVQVLRELCRYYKASASATDDNQMIALHYAAGSPVHSTSVIEELLKLNPDGVSASSKMKTTPLHCALNADAPIHIVKSLIESNVTKVKAQPAGRQLTTLSPAAVKGPNGNFPMHISAMKSSCTGVMNLLYEETP
jgi:ankyrin repeat protein